MQKSFVAASILVTSACVAILVLYCCAFSGGLSDNSADWGAFGDFIGGTCSLFLTAMNIWIFYKLTVAIFHQGESHAKANMHLEMQKFRLQQQATLIGQFTQAKENTFSYINLDEGIADIKKENFDEVMRVYKELRNYGAWLHVLDSEDFKNAYDRLRHIQNLLHDSGVDDEDFSDWQERMYGLYMKLEQIERMLKEENRQTLNEIIAL